MTGNVFRGYQQNALFVLTSVATGQSIHLLGMLTEALHTPLLSDRWLAIDQARMLRANARHLEEEILFRPNGRIVRRAHAVLEEAEKLLDRIAGDGLFEALAAGAFADTRRPRDGRPGPRRRAPATSRVLESRSVRRGTASRRERRRELAPARSLARQALRRQVERRRRADLLHAAAAPLGSGRRGGQALRGQDGNSRSLRHPDRGRRPRVHLLRRVRKGDPRGGCHRDRGRGALGVRALDARRSTTPSRNDSAAGSSCSGARSSPTLTPSGSTRSSTRRASPATTASSATTASRRGISEHRCPSNASCASRARSKADAILVSATVTQNEIHIRHLTDLVDMLEAEGLRDRVVLVAGGARLDHRARQGARLRRRVRPRARRRAAWRLFSSRRS